MSKLTLRLAFNIGAMALVGLSLVDVAFVFWAQRQLLQSQRASLAQAALAVATATPESSWPAYLAELGRTYAVSLTLFAPSATLPPLSSDPEGWRGGSPPALGFTHQGQRTCLSVPLPGAQGPWNLLAVCRPQRQMLSALYAAHAGAVAVLGVCLCVMVWVGVLFLRRSVVQPLHHLTSLVTAQDRAGLRHFDDLSGDDLGRLGHAIIAMAHALEEDRQRIAVQLADLETTQAQLIRAERLAVVGQLSAGLAHEIGNPLAVLQGFVELLQDATMQPRDRHEALVRMAKELTRIQKTIRQLLDFSRALPADAVAGDIAQALRDAVSLMAPQDCMRGISLQLPEPLPTQWVRLDHDALVQVLLNLFFNAADALNHRGTIAVRLQPRNGPTLGLEVEDSGPGIAPAVAAHVFDPFFTTKPAGVGTGLGLAVCERMITAVGGTIDVQPGKALSGACFVIQLPHAPGAPA